MTKLEKVMNGLEHCLSRYVDGLCDDCPYMGAIDKTYMIPMKCKEIIMRDALELLKEYQPKVLIMEDVPKYDVVWMETDKDEIFPALVNGATGDPKSKLHYFIHLYGVDGYIVGFPVFLYNRTWRCWTERPTEKQRKAEPWKGGKHK